MKLSDKSIMAWLLEYGIKTENGTVLDLKSHRYMFHVYTDLTPIQAVMKAAQITASTCYSLKTPWVAKNIGLDVIYTLPTEDDRNAFVGGKVNRIIAQNPILQEWTKDKDSIEQKQVGDHLIHFRGTWTQKAAIMVPSDLNIYDEIDASKASVIEQYSTRLQHSKYQWEWYLSHPSTEGTGVHKVFEKSDQKHWFVKCSHCNEWQFLSWPESVDLERQIYQCKDCKGEIYDNDRQQGHWVKKFRDREISGFWIPLLICPWVSAAKLCGYFEDKSEEYFYNKVLGLPYVGKGNKLTKTALMNNLTLDSLEPEKDERIVMGVDTGLKLDYVYGGSGLIGQGSADGYDELDKLMDRYPRMIAIVDAGGDLIGSRAFQARYKGRVFLCVTGGEKKASDEPTWNDDQYMVTADRNKMIQLVVDEFTDGRLPLQGTEDDWYDYWLDWNNLSRIKVYDTVTMQFKGFKWVRNGRDHKALATAYWRVGKMRFNGDKGSVIRPTKTLIQQSPTIKPDGTTDITYQEIMKRLKAQNNRDWRILR